MRPLKSVMNWASALSKQAVALSALEEVLTDVQEALGAEPDLAVLFISAHHAHAASALLAALRQRWPACDVVGCSGQGVLGAGEEVERKPAISVLAATLPGVVVEPLRITGQPAQGDAAAWRRAVGVSRDDVRALIVFPAAGVGDPEGLMRGLDLAFPEAVTVGGLPTAPEPPGMAPLLLGGQTYQEGMVGLALCGDLVVETLVAQGCRPVGKPMIITSCEGNIIYQLDTGRPDEMIRSLHAGLDARDRLLFQDSLFVGIEMQNKVGEYQQGDFVMRSVLGVDPDRGAMAVGSEVTPYQVMQFHLRDKETAIQDLERVLAEYSQAHPAPPAAALMFECVSRGQGLYGAPNYDSRKLQHALGAIPLAGFFGSGEFGPVNGRTFVHGHTTVIALFRPA